VGQAESQFLWNEVARPLFQDMELPTQWPEGGLVLAHLALLLVKVAKPSRVMVEFPSDTMQAKHHAERMALRILGAPAHKLDL